MSCSPCRLGGLHTTAAENVKLSDELRGQMRDAAEVWHGRCTGCPCQHRTNESAINPVCRPQGGPA